MSDLQPMPSAPRDPNRFSKGLPANFFLTFQDGHRSEAASPLTGRYTKGNAVDFFPEDTLSLQGMLQDIAAARRKIQFETFLFNDSHGEAIADALIERHRAGVRVQVVLDERAQKLDAERLAKKLKAAGIDVRYYDTRKLKMASIAVDHTKIAVFDDTVAWEGGANFDNEINRDLMCRIRGPAVRDIQRAFGNAWVGSGGEPEPLAPAPAPQGDVAIRVTQTAPDVADSRSAVLQKLRALQPGDFLDLWMMDLGDHAVIREMVAAQHRGVNLRILLDSTPPFIEALRASVRDKVRYLMDGMPDLYAVDKLQAAGAAVRFYQPPTGITKLHSKVAIFTYHDRVKQPDGHFKRVPRQEVMTGSTNWIRGAFDINHELSAFMKGGDAALRVQHFFENDWNNHSLRLSGSLPIWVKAWQQIKTLLTGQITKLATDEVVRKAHAPYRNNDA